MRFALVKNERVLAEPGLQGLCPACSQAVVAKCGKQRIWHWSHLGKRTCDKWWEPETEWHRLWKGNFPHAWQEYIQHDPTGEKHIADVRSEHGLVIEFQHSHLDPQERAARERFYGDMIWVVDGIRLKRDYPRFLEGKMNFTPAFLNGYFLKAHPEECFPAAWLESSVPVVFDFRGTAPTEPSDVTRELLWCLLPGRAVGFGVVVAISRSDFVQVVSSRAHLLPVPAHELVSTFAMQIQQQRTRAAIEAGRGHDVLARMTARANARRWRGRL